ncbi:GPW/gp25 family protein [Pendulispora brunnea]|uniref:GPW/gp25 family protein n=1 Tax=Pendulispora brunnea TaxID=2905690 RepID=A0ABZ2KKY5_9BACT
MLRRELGRGWGFPLRIGRHGGFVLVEGQDDIEESIRVIIGTRLGERVMRAGFGSEVPALLFEPATSATASRIADAIAAALTRWEPRIDVIAVTVIPDPDVATRLTASLTYRIRENNSVLNQVYPFYLNEGTEEP